MILGLLLLAGAAALLTYNQRESRIAGQSARSLLSELENGTKTEALGYDSPEELSSPEETLPMELIKAEMPTAEINGRTYLGEIIIPDLELSLPVLSGWSYENLKVAPCRYYGDLNQDNLVLLAHSYATHFGRISQLEQDAVLYFKDVLGCVTAFRVASLEVLRPNQVEEMTAGEYPLTLFTCTFDSQSRVTLRCRYETAEDIIEEGSHG